MNSLQANVWWFLGGALVGWLLNWVWMQSNWRYSPPPSRPTPPAGEGQ